MYIYLNTLATVGITKANIKNMIIMVEIILLDFLLKKFIFSPLFNLIGKEFKLMHIPMFLGIVIVFVIWLQYELRKTKKRSEKSSKDFWELENKSNLTRRTDISDLNYISIPLERLPMMDREDLTLNSFRDTIQKLSEKKILNLTGITNTELKLKYGAGNINYLSEYDNNFTTLVSVLHRWGERLYSLGFVSDAVCILEFAVSCGSDVSKTYRLLTAIYKEQKAPEKIDQLINTLTNIKMLRKEAVIEELNKIKSL